MTVQNALAGVAVKNLEQAVAWYAKLIGRPADSHPMAEVYEYHFPAGGWLQIFADADRAGKSSSLSPSIVLPTRNRVPNERIVLSWQWIEGTEENRADGVVSEVMIEIVPRADCATITLTHSGLPADQADDHTDGWNDALDKLASMFDRPAA